MAAERAVAELSREATPERTAAQQAGRFPKVVGERLVRGLGWFSIGLGLAEVVAAKGLARFLGIADRRGMLRGLGLREIACGVGILVQRRPVNWMRARVAGDAVDLALLGGAMLAPGTHRGRVAMATAAVAGVTALDVWCSSGLSQGETVRVRKSIEVNASPETLYQFWHNLGNLSSFMKHLVLIEDRGSGRSHWKAQGPAGTTVEWEAQITTDRPNELIAWRSLPGGDVDHAGSVWFGPAPGGRGTLVRMEIGYRPPAALLGTGVARLFGKEPGQQVQEDLRRFKQIIETGEIITTEGQPAGGRASDFPA
jgi:uncharacterized membrane protein